MPTPPESWGESHFVLRQVRFRLTLRSLLESIAFGLAFGATATGIVRLVGSSDLAVALAVSLATLSAGLVCYLRGGRARSLSTAADALERAFPHLQNIVVTAVELDKYPDRAQPWVRQRVFADADRLLDQVRAGSVVRLRRAVVLAAVALIVTAAVAIGLHDRVREAARTAIVRAGGSMSETTSSDIAVTLEPPAYTRQPVTRLTNPTRIEALTGTRLRIEIPAPQSPTSVRFGNTALRTTLTSGVARAELALSESGYLAIEGDGRLVLMPVTVIPDRPPTIRVERPGRDLLLADTATPVVVEASTTDDYGVASLTLRYTTVSGSGEQFEFREGEVPLTVVSRDTLVWQGRGTFALSRLGLQPGDSLVYRFVARDGRPGAVGTSSSDTFFVEIAGPGQVALEGSSLPPDRERYAFSQQMVVLKIERIRQREQHLSQTVLQQRASEIAAEQRAVKANFIFLMGGHVEDEEVEAEQSSEIQEGRLQDTARRDIVRAIDHMTRTEQALTVPDTGAALKEAKLAATTLQRAFGRNRYILRSLATRERIDPSRRLSGKLDGARSSVRSATSADPDLKPQRIRELLASAVSVANDFAAGSSVDRALAVLSERALAIAPEDPRWQRIAQRIGTVRDQLTIEGNRNEQLQALRETAGLIANEVHRVALPSEPGGPSGRTLHGTWAEQRALAQRTRR